MQKNCSKKHQLFEKWDNFENRPTCKGYSPCKAYRPCNMAGFGQKLKMPKKGEKPFCKNIGVVLCKKPFEKTPNIREMRQFWKSAILQGLYSSCKGYSLCKMVSLGQKLKMPKTFEKQFYKNIGVVLWKKPFEKTPNIREIRQFWKSAILQGL